MIRPYAPQDRDAVVALLKICGQYNPELSYREFSQPTILAEISGTVVGWVQMLPGQPYGYMSGIGVHPDYQDRGIGHKLIHAAEQVLQKHYGVVAWGGIVLDTNTNSSQRLEHLGGRAIGRGQVYFKNTERSDAP